MEDALFPVASPLSGLFENSVEAERFQLALLNSWRRQIALYTGNDTSLREETANELLRSLLMTIEAAMRCGQVDKSNLLSGDLSCVLQCGRAEISMITDECKAILLSLKFHPADYGNIYYLSTLRSIEQGFSRYDIRFSAHHFPASIDYFPALPICENLQGIFYIHAYLCQLRSEGALLYPLPEKEVRAVLLHSCAVYQDVPCNLYEPIAVNLLGLTILRTAFDHLTFDSAQRDLLEKRLRCCPDLPQQLRQAAMALYDFSRLSDSGAADCLLQTAERQAPRIQAALAGGSLSGIFL